MVYQVLGDVYINVRENNNHYMTLQRKFTFECGNGCRKKKTKTSFRWHHLMERIYGSMLLMKGERRRGRVLLSLFMCSQEKLHINLLDAARSFVTSGD